MNILFICDEYPPGKNGGIGTMVQVVGRELVKQGHNVYVAGLYRFRYEEADYEEDQGVKVWRLRFGVNLKIRPASRVYNLLEKFPAGIRKNLNGKAAFRKYTEFIKRLIDTEKIEIIEVPDWNTFALYIGFVVKWPAFKIPLSVKSHGSYTYFNTEMHLPLNRMLHSTDLELYKRADAYSAVSRYTAAQNKKLFPISRPVTILYNSIELIEDSAVVKKQERTVIFTGSLLEKKGIFQLMKAWNLVHKEFPEARLLVFGKGKTEKLKQLLDPSARATVFFEGHVERTILFNELSQATLAVFPSYSETFGLMCVEAMSVGCPVIYTQRSCGPEIVQDGENGLLVDPANVTEIAGSITELFKNKDLREHFSKNGKQTVRDKFNVVNSAKEHIEYYTRVIQEFKPVNKIA